MITKQYFLNEVHAACGIVFNKGGEVLLVRSKLIHGQERERSLGWEVPGGKVESGETVENATKREVKEETGLNVKVIKKVGSHPDAGDKVQFFLCTVTTDKPVDLHSKFKYPDEHDMFQWTDDLKVVRSIARPDNVALVVKAFNMWKEYSNSNGSQD